MNRVVNVFPNLAGPWSGNTDETAEKALINGRDEIN